MYDPQYSPHILKCIFIIVYDLSYAFYRLLIGLPSFIFDWILQTFFGSYLPSNILQLLDVETYNKCCYDQIKKTAISVGCPKKTKKSLSTDLKQKVKLAEQKEQHANSTERAWLQVRYEEDDQDTFVFAKCQARNFFVRLFMSVFNVYRNEILAYRDLELPVPTSKVHGVKWTRSRFVLVLEDLSSKGVEFPNIWSKNVDEPLCKQVLTSLAKLHAKYWQNCPTQVWNDENRPYFALVSGMYTLFNVERNCKPGLFSPEMHKVYMQALWHWMEYREYLSKSQPKTLCHGDTHMGNFYIEKDGTIGAIDFQVLSEENPMRDVSYFLSSSCDPEFLEQREKHLIDFYLKKLHEFGVPKKEVPSMGEAYFAYRLQLFYALYAFVFSGGFANLMDHIQTDCGVERILKAMERVDSAGAFYAMLDGRVQ